MIIQFFESHSVGGVSQFAYAKRGLKTTYSFRVVDALICYLYSSLDISVHAPNMTVKKIGEPWRSQHLEYQRSTLRLLVTTVKMSVSMCQQN